MFDLDQWREVYNTLRSNWQRSLLTAVGVGWGILMLIVVLGAGSGLENGIRTEFSGMPTNCAYLWGGRTSKAYKGLPAGRIVRPRNSDIEALKQELPDLAIMAPQLQLGGYRSNNSVTHGAKSGAYSVMGNYPEILPIQNYKVVKGRFINPLDLTDRRKVCVIGESVRKVLFGEEDAVGGNIRVNGVYFKVIGVFASALDGERAEREEQTVIIPFTTFQKAFNVGDRINWISMKAHDHASAEDLENDARAILCKRHSVHPDDVRAFGGFNSSEEQGQINMVFLGINWLGWFVGVLTLLAGVIGVSNIMLVVIRERTREIGIRRAIGAPPSKIVSQILVEAITLTTLAGLAGMLLGVGLIELIGEMDVEFFSRPVVNYRTVVAAILLLVFAGVLAGLAPAIKAIRVKTIDALRSE